MDKYINFGGKAIRIQTKGDRFAPHHRRSPHGAVVFLHGYLETLEIWTNVLDKLSANEYVAAIDLPGHGFSESQDSINTMEYMADAVEAVRQDLGVDQIAVVGHSMGGYAALKYAEKYREYTAGLCLFHSTPNADSEEKALAREEEISHLLNGKEDVVYIANLPKLFAPQNQKAMKPLVDEMINVLHLVEPVGLAACVRGMQKRQDMNDFVLRFHAPLLMVFGRNDQYISAAAAEGIAQLHKHAQIEWLENSGHLGFVEEETRAVEILAEFAQQALHN